jgi:hypothetical protein
MPGQLDAAPASETVPIPTGFVTVSHTIGINPVGNLLGVVGVKGKLFWFELVTKFALKGFCSIVEVFFQCFEMVALV